MSHDAYHEFQRLLQAVVHPGFVRLAIVSDVGFLRPILGGFQFFQQLGSPHDSEYNVR